MWVIMNSYSCSLQAFSFMDSDNDGYINTVDLSKHASKIGLSFHDVQEMIEEADKDGDGKINKEEFLATMKRTNLFRS